MKLKYYSSVINKLSEAYALHTIVKNNSGKIVDFIFVEANPAYKKLTRLNFSELIGNRTSNIIAKHKSSDSLSFYQNILEDINNKSFEIYSESLSSWFKVNFEIIDNDYLIILLSDITSIKLIEKYRESEIKYRQIFENANDAIFIMSGDIFIDCNDKTLEIFECKRSEIIGKEPYKFSPPTQPDGESSIIKAQNKIKAALDGMPQRFEWIHTKLNGTPFFAEVSLNTYQRPKGELCVQAIVRDISQQKMAEQSLKESESKYKSLFDSMPTGFYRSTPEGYFVDANPAFIRMLGYDSLEELKKVYIPTEIYVHTSERDEAVSDNSAFINKLEVYRLKRKDGKIIWIEDNARYIRDKNGKILFHEGICRDITDKKSAEEERTLKEKLEKKIIVAEETLKFKQNFLANMSHEMRTPLTGILGMAELLRNTKLEDTQLNYLSTILQSGDNLKEIINKVLDFSKIEAGQVRLEKKIFRLERLMDNAESLFKSICKKPIIFEYEIDKNLPEYIKADQLRIIQIINNLVSNAVKFTKKGKVTITATLIRWSDDNKKFEIKISVTDTGKGIAKSIQKKLFKPFCQIEDIDTRQFEGTGLGLSICKELAVLHGGKIGVESKVGNGSTFWFTLMAEKAGKAAKEKKEKRRAAKTMNLRILLTEDNKVNQEVIKLSLISMGHEVSIASNGKEALKIFKPGKFDLILMDIQMPVMDGISAANKLKKTYKQLPPIVGLSANAFEGDREKYMKKGMDEYLIKPLDLDCFNEVINKLL